MGDGEVLAEVILEGDDEFVSSMDEMEDGLLEVDAAGLAAGATLAGIGGAMQKTLGDTQDMRSELAQTALDMGITAEEANELAREVSNVTFPVEDATATMDILARQGVDTKEEMAELSTEFDTLGDAVGVDAATAAEEGGRAIKAFGGDLDDVSEQADTFTFVTRNTTLEFSEFTNSVERIAPELQEMGLTMEDTAAIFAALEEEGISGRTAIREVRQATNTAEGDMGKFRDAIGLTEEQIGAQTEALEAAKGSTEAHAEAANSSLTTMDEISHAFDEAKLAAGGMLAPVDAAAPALMAMGGAMSVVSTINLSAVVPSLVAVYGALLPILPILLAVAAGAALLWKAWDSNFLGIQNVTGDAIEAITGWFDDLMSAGGMLLDFYLGMWQGMIDAAVDFIDAIPGVDSEDIIGDIDTEEITDTLFPPKPEVEAAAQETGEVAGKTEAEAAVEARQGVDMEALGASLGGGVGGMGGPGSEATAASTEATMDDLAQGTSAPPGASGGSGQTVQVDARMEATFNGVTWEEAMEKTKAMIEDRISSIERRIKRLASRGSGRSA